MSAAESEAAVDRVAAKRVELGAVAEVYELGEPIPAPTYPDLLTDVAWDELIPPGAQVKTAAEIRADSAAAVRRQQEIDRRGRWTNG